MTNNNVVGRIHSFESFGAVDGPGIRFVIFMQGCPLKCKYCQNRDTWNINGGKEYTTSEIINKVMRCKPYIDNSNGGVTVSGGEPLLQANFIIDLFKQLKKYSIHTAIDTSGCMHINDTIKELLEYTDLVILDIKHIDEEKCISLTSMSNKNELEFAKYCSSIGKDIWIRQVLIPGYTDSKEDLIKTRKFIDSLDTVKNIEILPYHSLGKFKWTDLGEEYPFENVPSPNEDDIENAMKILIKRKSGEQAAG